MSHISDLRKSEDLNNEMLEPKEKTANNIFFLWLLRLILYIMLILCLLTSILLPDIFKVKF